MKPAQSLLRWKEPVAFRRAWTRKYGPPPNRWIPVLILIGFNAVCLTGMVLRNNLIGGSLPVTIAIVFAASVALAYGVPLVSGLDPHLVAISERGVGRRSVNFGRARIENWRWDEIAECRLEFITLEQRDYRIFTIAPHDGTETVFALDDEPSRAEEIQSAVRANGMELNG